MKNTKTQNIQRDASGKFVSPNNTVTNTNSTVVKKLLRDSSGKFASMKNSNVVKNKSTTFSLRLDPSVNMSSVKTNNTTKKSSFINSLTINGTNVDVVMTRYPKITYHYKPTPLGMSAVKKAVSNGTSLGHVYNENLKGREISRTVYK